jgi:hypothetical protein
MDVDELLRATDLPEVAVRTEDALAATVRRGRAGRRRRTTVLGACTVLAVGGLAAGVLALAGGDDPDQVATGTTGSTEPPGSTGSTPSAGADVSPTPEPGDAATWSIDPGAPPSPTSSTFTALVSRLACNGGVTGTVLRPGVVATATEVVVTFTVADDIDGGTCPDNDEVPYEVELGQPLGDRVLVDGGCAPGGLAAINGICLGTDGDVRWRPAGDGSTESTEPRECAAAEGEVTDVATEPPDWRQNADYLPWTDREACLLRIDVLAERPGPEHCDSERASVLITGRPLGARYTNAADDTEYVRDPEGVFDDAALTAGFDPDAEVPATAVDSGYRRGDLALWHDPTDPSAIWIVGPDHTERWPAGEPPPCR